VTAAAPTTEQEMPPDSMSSIPQRLLSDSLLEGVRSSPDKPAVVIGDEAHSYADLLDAARRFAGAVRERGLERGDRVAIYMDNSWSCVVSIFGTALAGGVFLVINPQTKSEKLAYILENSGARILCTEARLSRFFGPVLKSQAPELWTLCHGEIPENSPELTPFDETLENAAAFDEASGALSVDLAALIYTSGSTGDPKGVMMTHQSMVFTAESLVEYLRLSSKHRILNVLPLAFDYGLYQLLMSVRAGATLVLENSFAYPAKVLQQVLAAEATVFPGVPTIFASLISTHQKTPLSFPSVLRVTNTAAALPADFIPRLREIFPNALIFKMYGLTECKRVSYLEPEELEDHLTSVGKAIPGTEVYLLDDQGEAVAPGEIGILHVRGAHVMQGYWKKPRETAEMLREGSFPCERALCCQDLFRIDEEGYLYFVGRNDDIIKTRGEKVSPVEVENTLHGIDGILDAAVLGVPHETLGQSIRAFVSLEEGASLTERQVIKECMARLENFMVPKQVVFLSELPKTATGKIRKRGLVEPTEE
jgi:long-chain acyl-CoA synthetase